MVASKRFIAGAVCPSCGVADKIYVLKDGKRTSRHCSRCEFGDDLAPEVVAEPSGNREWEPVRLTAADNQEKTQE
jgi:uncharacterized metal-binding protein (TIGR02443 family)